MFDQFQAVAQQLDELLEGYLVVRVIAWALISFMVCFGLLSLYSAYEERKRQKAWAAHQARMAARPKIDKQDLTRAQLRGFDGSDAKKPTLLAIDGFIFDVTGSPFYGPGGPYAKFAGRDATRCMALFNTEDADLDNPSKDGLNSDQLSMLADWLQKFQSKYTQVGRLLD